MGQGLVGSGEVECSSLINEIERKMVKTILTFITAELLAEQEDLIPKKMLKILLF